MNNKSVVPAALIILLISGLIAVGVYAYRGSRPASTETPANSSGADESGEPSGGEADLAGIKQAFMDKYGKSDDEIMIHDLSSSVSHARGGVKFAMDGEFGPGGIFLAYKDKGAWKIAFDGNGMYSCSEMRQYDFPESMTPDCADGAPGVLDSAQLANPASAYCEDQGGSLEIRTAADGGQSGYCVFANGSECEEWAFFRGECGESIKN